MHGFFVSHQGVIPYEAAVSCCVGKYLEMALDGEFVLKNN